MYIDLPRSPPAATAEIFAGVKDALASELSMLDMFAPIWDGHAIVYLAGCGSVSFGSGVRLFRQQRGESFALRHDAARFCRDETRRHYRCDS